jgi:cytochrome c556
MKRLFAFGIAAMVSLGAMSVAVSQDAPATPEDQAKEAILMRQGLFKLMGWNMAPLGAMLRNKMPFDAAVAQKSAQRMEALSAMIPDAFTLDTRKFTSVKTGALEGVWGSKADFTAKANEMNKAATALSAAAKTGDKAATLKAAGALGKACGSCHDAFRAE